MSQLGSSSREARLAFSTSFVQLDRQMILVLGEGCVGVEPPSENHQHSLSNEVEAAETATAYGTSIALPPSQFDREKGRDPCLVSIRTDKRSRRNSRT